MTYSELREKILLDNQLDYYRELIGYMGNPLTLLSESCNDYLCSIQAQDIVANIRLTFENNRDEYRDKFRLGQLIIWQQILDTYSALRRVDNQLTEIDVVYYSDNYLKATEQVKAVLSIYSEAKSAITRMESNLSIDRYLDNIGKREFAFLVSIFDSIHRRVDVVLDEYKTLYTKKWNTTNICSLVLHQQVRSNMNNQVCSLTRSGIKRTVLFIVDGWGMGQYLWSKKVVPGNVNFSRVVKLTNYL